MVCITRPVSSRFDEQVGSIEVSEAGNFVVAVKSYATIPPDNPTHDLVFQYEHPF
jgi:hypothetical protein